MIRLAVSEDIDKVEEGYREHFAYEREHGAYTVFQEGIYPTRKEAMEAYENKNLYVYEEDGMIMGSVILDQEQPEEYRKINWQGPSSDDKVLVVHLLMVRPSAAGKGVGSALVDYAVEEGRRRSCAAVRLDTGTQNIPAASLYKKKGFQVAETSTMKVGGAIAHTGHLFFEKML